MNISQYLEILNNRYQSGISREHSYRADLENLIRALVPTIHVTNEPADVTDCGNPDYVLTKGKIPVGYIEAKDIGKDLSSKVYDEQFNRYRDALDNLIITDYLWFRFYDHSELVHEIRIGKIEGGKIVPLPDNFKKFENLIINFSGFIGQTIRSPKKLAIMMANKARLLQNILENAVTSDEKTQENTSLKGQFETFKEILIHDLTPKGFADIYAQTLAHGMFAARLHDPTLEDFSRQEAAELIPKSNPFLRKLFGYVAGPDIDERIKAVVDNLAEVFRATNVEQILKNFGRATQTQDAIIHFYETFLAEYDPKLRKARGVWYTPEPVVKFIVRAVDDILKTEFKLPQGLADTSKTKIKVNTDVADKRSSTGYKQVEKEVHKVQILDPATGTGTFLAEVISYIYSERFEKMHGAWSGYVEEHLIPRINGFELLMASYAMAHLKLDMLLKDTGYESNGDSQRLNVYLTNSLEEHHKDTGTLFSNWLSTEANEANHIKRDTPVMCVIGNPPYSGISSNKGEWISELIEDYKYVDGVHFNERKHWLNDDYVKFMRYGQHFIEKNGEGILAFINPHGFLDNPTFRGMRWNLLKTYDKIYTIDLHGNTKRKEKTPDGGKDENVFDIMQGVSINLLIKTDNKRGDQLGEIYHFDCYGKRKIKYDFLNKNRLKSIDFKHFKPEKPYYTFVPSDREAFKQYKRGFKSDDLFRHKTSGVQTSRDFLVIDEKKNQLIDRLEKFLDKEKSIENIREEFFAGATSKKYPKGDTRGWKIDQIRPKLQQINLEDIITEISYRPFDKQHIAYSPLLVDWTREKIQKHLLKENISLTIGRQGQATGSNLWNLIFIQDTISDLNLFYRGGGIVCPLYIYTDIDENLETLAVGSNRVSNLNNEIVKVFESRIGYQFTSEKEEKENSFAPIDILDYVYAVLHSPWYRRQYEEFLKIDFPRIPYPKDTETFHRLVELGGYLRQIHLLESQKVEEHITSYPISGDNRILRKITKSSPGFEPYKDEPLLGKVWINDEQYFDGVPKVAWQFYVGGYQPAQKWLKDRKERKLSYEEIEHYQKMIVALTETDRLMKEIDKIDIINE
ncbi:type ISP restriction/modification enzyme [Christiangramia portivictoriae]|uniref:type ISP restriction/modification enzyme n=1 Tax=Christiangramia portivictoriae TaxID=326069 RepID=UPI0004038622|nr:type ISP restriction/modification enzyme [Christiangramia portivictoriae]